MLICVCMFELCELKRFGYARRLSFSQPHNGRRDCEFRWTTINMTPQHHVATKVCICIKAHINASGTYHSVFTCSDDAQTKTRADFALRECLLKSSLRAKRKRNLSAAQSHHINTRKHLLGSGRDFNIIIKKQQICTSLCFLRAADSIREEYIVCVRVCE